MAAMRSGPDWTLTLNLLQKQTKYVCVRPQLIVQRERERGREGLRKCKIERERRSRQKT